jgi:hypothetical protein
VTKAEAVDSEEALRRIRGEGSMEFDPRTMALLEIAPGELPALPGGMPVDATAEITEYRPNHLRIKTSASTPAVLVVSEVFYPGWKATIDGQPAQIMIADYLLRGVSVPEGTHEVEMRYTAPSARLGLIISIVALLSYFGLCAMSKYRTR